MSIRELLPPPATATGTSPADLGTGGRALSPDVACPVVGSVGATSGAFSEVSHDLTPTTPASGDSARGFGSGRDLSDHLLGVRR